MPRPRDTLRQRVYDSFWSGGSAAASRLIDGGSTVASTGNVSIAACQAYVDDLLSQRWLRARWGTRRILVGHKTYGNATWDGSDISLPPWARDEPTILHEVAHALTPRSYAAHGPEFVGVLLTLVRYRVGAEAARSYRASLRANRVRVSMAAVPAPDRPVPTRAEVAARKRVAATRPPSAREAAEAAAILRRAVATGAYGPPGRKGRTHALATARGLDALAATPLAPAARTRA